jgi:hypothetical protein
VEKSWEGDDKASRLLARQDSRRSSISEIHLERRRTNARVFWSYEKVKKKKKKKKKKKTP